MAKKIIVNFLKVIGGILGFILLYILFALVIPYIEIDAKETTEPKTVVVYIYTNGVHTDIVMPVKNDQMDWSATVPFSNTTSKDTNYSYIGVGWGDKGFYLDTPTWADLKFSTAFNAAFWLGESALHTTYYGTMTEAEDCKKIMLTKSQYAELVKFVNERFDKTSTNENILIPTNAVYGKSDAFYEAKGSYSFLYTCNTWTNDALKVSGQKAALWTPTDFGIFQHYK